MNREKLKEYIKKLTKEILDEESTSGDVGSYSTPKAFKRQGGFQEARKPKTSKIVDYKKIWEEKIYEAVKKQLLNESTYSEFKKGSQLRTKSETLHHGIKQVRTKLQEINRIVEYVSRLKEELNEGEEEGVKYWKQSEKAVGQISEMINSLSNKVKNLNQ